MNSYDALAASYDALTADAEHLRRAAYLDRLFRRERAPVETVLDLACGTGTIACLLAERGYRVLAVDGSEEMLTQAAKKAETLGERAPLFLHQAMPRLRLGREVDAAISHPGLSELPDPDGGPAGDAPAGVPVAEARRRVLF